VRHPPLRDDQGGALFDVASTLARAWTRIYTRGMPVDAREIRCAEIETDLHEHGTDARATGVPEWRLAADILLRTALGARHDLGWRLEIMNERQAAAKLREDPMDVSSGRTAWLGIAALMGGSILALVTVVYQVLGNPGISVTASPMERLAGTVRLALGGVAVLLIVLGVSGLYLQQRARTRPIGKVGVGAVVSGFAAVVLGVGVGMATGWPDALNLLLEGLMLSGEMVLVPLGFLLMGLGMPSPSGRIPLVLGCYLTLESALGFVGMALVERFPAMATFYLPGSLFDAVSAVIFGVLLAAMGYMVWSESRAPRLAHLG